MKVYNPAYMNEVFFQGYLLCISIIPPPSPSFEIQFFPSTNKFGVGGRSDIYIYKYINWVTTSWTYSIQTVHTIPGSNAALVGEVS